MRAKMLNAKHSRFKGYYFEQKIPIDINNPNYLESGVPFRFGFVNENNKSDDIISTIRVVGTQFIIRTYRDLMFKKGDRVAFDNLIFDVENVNISFNESKGRNKVKQYFLTLK